MHTFTLKRHGNDITHSVERLLVTSNISVASGLDLSSTNELFEREVRAIYTVLSLCYRQPVRHSESEYFTISNLRKRISRRRLSAAEKTIKQDELISYGNFIDGGLEKLLRTFQSSERAEEISRVIDFLAYSGDCEQ